MIGLEWNFIWLSINNEIEGTSKGVTDAKRAKEIHNMQFSAILWDTD